MANLPGTDVFCTRQPHLVGEEEFGSQKRKIDVPFGFEGESHRPDKVYFSRPWMSTRSTRINLASCSLPDMVEELSPDSKEDQAPNTVEVCRPLHVIAIQETACDVSQWHIARLHKSSSKTCFVQQAVTKKKCTAKIVQGNRSTAAPTYTGIMVHIKRNQEERMQFIFATTTLSVVSKARDGGGYSHDPRSLPYGS